MAPKAASSPTKQQAAATKSEPPRQPGEILINGYLYDANGFNHPGGSIIKFFWKGGDATDAFEQFHIRSEKAQKMLANMPRRVAPPAQIESAEEAYRIRKHDEMTKDLVEWTRKLQKEGWFDWSLTHTIYRVVEILVLLCAGFYLIMNGWTKVGLAVLGIFQGRCGWLMHEAGHWSMTSNIKLDIFLQELIFGFGPGMSGGWWRSQHNRHHATPQKLEHDVDLETLPLLAFNTKIAQRMKKNIIGRAWLTAQAFLFVPITALLVALSWQLILHPRFVFRTKNIREAVILAVRYYALHWFATQVMHVTLPQALAAYLFSTLIGAIYIFGNFALSHTHLPVTEPHEYAHWLEYASVHTINISPNILTDWWMGYLNYQIEHHIFPCMPQYKFVKLWPQTKAFFDKHGLVYDVRGYWNAMGTTFANLYRVGMDAASGNFKED